MMKSNVGEELCEYRKNYDKCTSFTSHRYCEDAVFISSLRVCATKS